MAFGYVLGIGPHGTTAQDDHDAECGQTTDLLPPVHQTFLHAHAHGTPFVGVPSAPVLPAAWRTLHTPGQEQGPGAHASCARVLLGQSVPARLSVGLSGSGRR